MRATTHNETTKLVRYNLDDERGRTVDCSRDGDCNDGYHMHCSGDGEKYRSIHNYRAIGNRQRQDQQEDVKSSDRLVNLALIAFTTPGVKFFKSAQSSFQEYLMTDPQLQMSATTYGVLLTLISMPIVPLLGGTLLDYKKGTGGHRFHASSTANGIGNDIESSESDDESQHDIVSSLRTITTAPSGTALQNDQKASQSNAYCWFLGVTLLGIVVYGFGLGSMHSIPVGLFGAFVFGVGEGCVMVAARAFVGHEFWGGDGAFAQGVLIAMNNLAMMASKNIVPWLIETEHQSVLNGDFDAPNHLLNNAITSPDISDEQTDNSIEIGIIACCVVQLISVGAGLLYASRNGGLCPDRKVHHHRERAGEAQASSNHSGFSSMAALVNLPLTFWVVAIGRAIFLVTFKVFSRYSNSFLIEEYGVDAVSAGRISSVNELFALFSPLVGFLAYRSPGGIVVFALAGAVLGTVSIASLAFVPVSYVLKNLPGGPLTPLVGISIAHGIIIPISIAMIPHTVPATQLGMAFAIFEVLGSTLNLTDIVFGWLRDHTGNYDIPMQLLFAYALCGTVLLWLSRKLIGSIGILRNTLS